VCPFTPREEWVKLFLISIFCCFESLRRFEETSLEGAREKVGGKSLEGVKKLNCNALERGGEGTFTIEKRN
jgi:hypothetical protein